MMKTHHMCVDVSGAIKMRLFKYIQDAKGNTMSEADGEKALRYLQANGVKVLPMGKPCAGFSNQTGCPGHRVKTKEKKKAARRDPNQEGIDAYAEHESIY